MKTIVLCSSVAFYRHVNELATELESRGFTVLVPETAKRLEQSGDYDVDKVKTWYTNTEDFAIKARLMRGHFDKVAAGDDVLVVNDRKHDIDGYIGPNVLMEMGLAFYLGKPIYVLNPVSKDLPVYEEIVGMGSIILESDLTKIKL